MLFKRKAPGINTNDRPPTFAECPECGGELWLYGKTVVCNACDYTEQVEV